MAVAHGAVHEEHRLGFIRRYIFSQDHKIIGIQYMMTSLFMAAVGGVLAMLIRMELGWPGGHFGVARWLFPGGFSADGALKPDFYLAVVTMHGSIMIFFVLTTALSGGFGNFLIPLTIGARDMAFPFLNMLSYWLYPPAIVVLLSSFFVAGGAPNSGWTAYPPLSALRNAAPGSGLGQTLWLVSLAILIVSFLFGSLNYITTVLQLRTRGMSMGRMPLVTWAQFTTAILMLLSFPVLFAAVVMLLFDRHMFTSGMNPLVGTAFMVTTLAIAIPSAVKTFNWVATLWRARIHFTPAMLFAIGFVSLFITGGLTGIFLGSPAVDVYFHDTFFIVAHFHFVMASAALFGLFGGLYHWFPKMFGRMMNERLGKMHFWLTFVGIYATFFPMHFLGMAGGPRRYYSPQMYDFLRGLAGLNMFVSVAAFGLGLAQLIFIYKFFRSFFWGAPAGRNPWEANTLGGQTETTPPPGDWGPPPPPPSPAAPPTTAPRAKRLPSPPRLPPPQLFRSQEAPWTMAYKAALWMNLLWRARRIHDAAFDADARTATQRARAPRP